MQACKRDAHCGLMAVQRKGCGCGPSCMMSTQAQARVHHTRAVPSALALATRPAFSMAEAAGRSGVGAGLPGRPLQACSGTD